MPPSPHLKIFCDIQLDAEARRLLEDGVAPHQLIFPQKAAASVLSQPEADPAFAEAHIAFGQPGLDSIAAAPHLRWVQVTSAGYTRYDTPGFRAAAAARGLLLTNSSSVFAEPCAEHVLSFLLAQARQLPIALQTRVPHQSGDWQTLRRASACLRGQSVVILGYGAIAARLVELLAPFHMNIRALRRRPKGDESVSTFTHEDLPAALAEADHIIDILPENAESNGFISADRLAAMKPGAIFYNIGRGATVDQAALAASLHSGHLGAAWLDVTAPEPLPDGHPLLTAPHCYITPHTAGGHGDENRSLILHFLENLRLFLDGSPLRDRVL